MISERDLVQALDDLADLAPAECTQFEPRACRGHRRLIATGAGALIAAAVAVAAFVIPSALTRPTHPDSQPRVSSAQLDPAVRARLVAIARGDATANGDPAATALAVKTTYQRLSIYDRLSYLELTVVPRSGSASAAPAAHPRLTAPLWVIELQGTFDGGNTVLEVFVDGISLDELGGAAINANRESTLRSLGSTVRLTPN